MKKMVYILFAMFIANVALAQTVEFQVDMSIKAMKGEFNPATDTVRVAGSFNAWSTTADNMLDPNNDSIYTVSKTLNVGDTVNFKFIYIKAGTVYWEADPNRQYIVPAGNSTFYAYFDRDSVFGKDIEITFMVDMEFEIVSGRFNPEQDTLSARGSFNGWTGVDIMSKTLTNPNQYEVTVTENLAVGAVINYKYAYQGPRGTTWEGGSDKQYTITQQDFDLGLAFVPMRIFNDLTLETVTNFPVDIKFIVDVTGAVSSVTNVPFTEVTSVVIAGPNAPLQWPGAGWPNSDSIYVKFLRDDGTNGDSAAGDKFFTGIITFPQYSPLRIEYKYGANWGLPTNTGANDNESSVGTNHFINLTSTIVSATVRNKWAVMGDHPLDQIVLSDVKEIGNGVPESYTLDQNYPNPFNPETNIRFSIPQSGLVTLKVYNALGQEVATLLNEEKNAGSYEFNFNASSLSSGIYFYKIQSNNYTATKKMILMK